MTTRGLILTSAIHTHKEQDVATVDIDTAFLHMDNAKTIIMKLQSKMVDLVVPLDPTMY